MTYFVMNFDKEYAASLESQGTIQSVVPGTCNSSGYLIPGDGTGTVDLGNTIVV